MDTPSATSESDALGLRCMRCGYDLRGQSSEGFCPECGLSVEQSRSAGTHLRRGRPAWLYRLSIGTWLLIATPAVLVGSAVILAMNENANRLIEFTVPLIPAVVLCAAVILLTSRETQFERRLPGNRLRVATRVSSVCPLIVASCVDAAIYEAGRSTTIFVLAGASVLLLVPTYILVFWYFKTLAHRIESPSLAEHSAIVAAGVSASIVLPEIMTLWQPESIWLVLVMLVTICLFLMWSTLVLSRFAWQFAKVARAARLNWIAADATVNQT